MEEPGYAATLVRDFIRSSNRVRDTRQPSLTLPEVRHPLSLSGSLPDFPPPFLPLSLVRHSLPFLLPSSPPPPFLFLFSRPLALNYSSYILLLPLILLLFLSSITSPPSLPSPPHSPATVCVFPVFKKEQCI